MLKTTRIVGQRPGPHLLITGGVHGDEFEPMAAIRRLAGRVEPDELQGTLSLVPVVNEDAFRCGRRTASDGLDLARTCPGTLDGSVTQRTAAWLSEAIRAVDDYVDLHTGGTTLSVFPLAGYMLHTNAKILERQRVMARAFNVPVVWGTDAALEGRSLSVARDAGIPAIYVEYGGAATCDPRGVETLAEGCLNVMASLGMLIRPPPLSNVRWFVEDARSGSGHMQRSQPAPCGGYFEPAVALGGMVEAGEPIGWIVDSLGHDPIVVAADVSGLVLVLRAFPSVLSGDSLAVILEVDNTG